MATLDLFTTAVMLKAIEKMPRIYTFLADTFGAEGECVEDDRAIYDYRKGPERRMAQFVLPGTGGVLMNRDGFEMREIGFPTIAPERLVTLQDISGRMFGEQITGSLTPEQRAKRVLARDLTDLRSAIAARKDWMIREVLLKGKLDIFQYTNDGKQKESTMVADFGFTNNYTPSVNWDQPSAKIDYDMHKIFDLVYDGLGEVDIIVMSPDVANAMLENSAYMKFMDMKNVDMGEISTRYRGQGVRVLGYNSDGVLMVSYSGKFLDDDRTVKPVLPTGTLIAGSARNKPLKFMYGPVTLVEGQDERAQYHTYIKKEVPVRLGSTDKDGITTRLISRPTIVPENIDAWAVAKVL